jgi:hypothetical protein
MMGRSGHAKQGCFGVATFLNFDNFDHPIFESTVLAAAVTLSATGGCD